MVIHDWPLLCWCFISSLAKTATQVKLDYGMTAICSNLAADLPLLLVYISTYKSVFGLMVICRIICLHLPVECQVQETVSNCERLELVLRAEVGVQKHEDNFSSPVSLKYLYMSCILSNLSKVFLKASEKNMSINCKPLT